MHSKIREFPILKEQLTFLEYEKKDTLRILEHYKKRKIGFIYYILNKGEMYSSNCPELGIISLKIKRAIDDYYVLHGKKLIISLLITPPFIIFYKSVFLNYIIFRRFYTFFYNKLKEYLSLIEDEIIFCKKQISLGFVESQTLKYHKKIYIDENYVKLKEEGRDPLVFIPPEYKVSNKKFKTEFADIQDFDTIQSNKTISHNPLLFLTKHEIIQEIKTKTSTKSKLLYCLDIQKNLSLLQNSFNEIMKDMVGQRAIKDCLQILFVKQPEGFYYIKSMINLNNVNDDSKKQSDKISRYKIILIIAIILKDLGILITFLNNEIAYFEKRLSLEDDGHKSESSQDEKKPKEKPEPRKTKAVNKNDQNFNIIWLGNEAQLIDLFMDLNKATLFPNYEEDEILSHFVSERMKRFESLVNFNDQLLHWLGTDEEFAYFINELTRAGFVNVSNKYKAFSSHFLNREGKPFKNLAQKFNNHKNHGSASPQIDEAVKNINKDKSN